MTSPFRSAIGEERTHRAKMALRRSERVGAY
jgi:hypothetical protein